MVRNGCISFAFTIFLFCFASLLNFPFKFSPIREYFFPFHLHELYLLVDKFASVPNVKNAARLHEKFVVELPFSPPSSFLFVLMYSFFSLSLLYQIHLSFSPLGIFLLFLTQHNKPFPLFLHSLNSQAKFNFSASRGTTLDLLK